MVIGRVCKPGFKPFADATFANFKTGIDCECSRFSECTFMRKIAAH